MFVLVLFTTLVSAQDKPKGPETQEAGDDGVPVILKHIPNWQSYYQEATFFNNEDKFHSFFSDRAIIKTIDFIPGTEAAYVKYQEGNLLMVEYMTPQASADTDRQVLAKSKNSSEDFLYRRIGNYNVFLFDAKDKTAGNLLLDEIKYQKVVTWPYGNPMYQFQREREFIIGTKSLFIYTVVFIVTGFGVAILIGLIAGIVYFKVMQKHRVEIGTFSDAGGLTRLNLDGLSADMPIDTKQLTE